MNSIEASGAEESRSVKQLELTIGVNRSDTTFGWKGYKNAISGIFKKKNENHRHFSLLFTS